MTHQPTISLQDIYDMRQDPSLRNRVAAACWNESEGIRQETDTQAPLYAERKNWAAGAWQDDGDGATVQGMVRAVVTNATIQGYWRDNNKQFLDSDILFVVRQNVDFFAQYGTGTNPTTPPA